jgi:hypothetical protein
MYGQMSGIKNLFLHLECVAGSLCKADPKPADVEKATTPTTRETTIVYAPPRKVIFPFSVSLTTFLLSNPPA